MLWKVRRLFTVQLAGHGVMFAFAAASLANIEAFFAAVHPGLPLLSWGLGLALGSGLLVMAGLLSGMTWDWRDSRFQVVTTTTAALALLSGGLQAAAYSVYMTNPWAAVIVGLALPVVGELGVALAISAYTEAQREQRFATVQRRLADGVRAHIGEAVALLDPAQIQAQVEQAAGEVAQAIIGATVTDLLADLQRPLSLEPEPAGAPNGAPRGAPEAHLLDQVRSKVVTDRLVTIAPGAQQPASKGFPALGASRPRSGNGAPVNAPQYKPP